MKTVSVPIQRMVDDYKIANRNLLAENPEFHEWLEKEYVPITGGWQY
jgi:hypothetical protein